MRLVHEYNREKVERYLHKKRLEKIAILEELDRRGELSDRSMLSAEYDYESFAQLLADNETEAEEYLKKALRIHLDMFEQGIESEIENVSFYYRQLGNSAKALKQEGKAEIMYRKSEEYAQLMQTLLVQKQMENSMEENNEDVPELSPEEMAAIFGS